MKRLTRFDTFDIPIDEIYVDQEFNCRGYFTMESVQSLSAEIADRGLDVPIVVRPFDKVPGYKYHLVAGHRRFTACVCFLKWEKIPAQIRELTDEEAASLNLSENFHRKDLNMLQEARGIANNPFYQGKGCREIANRLGKTEAFVLQRRKLLTLPEPIQKLAAAGKLTGENIENIARLKSVEKQLHAAELYAAIKGIRKNAPLEGIPEEYKSKFRNRRTKDTVRAKIVHLFERGITSGIGPRALAWQMGTITDEQLEPEIEEHLALLKELEEWRTGQRRLKNS